MTAIHIILIAVTVGSAAFFWGLGRATMRAGAQRQLPRSIDLVFMGVVPGSVAVAITGGFCLFCSQLTANTNNAASNGSPEELEDMEVLPNLRSAYQATSHPFNLQELIYNLTTASIQNADVSTKPSAWTGLPVNRDAELGQVKGVAFDKRSLKSIRARGAFFARASFIATDLREGDFSNCDFRGSAFTHVKAKDATFSLAAFSDPVPALSREDRDRLQRDIDEMHKNFHSSDFQDVTFVGSRIDRAELAFTFALECHFEKADLLGVKAIGSVFTKCHFAGAKLVDADFAECRFSDCDLANVNLYRANLEYASFSRTNVTSADFTEADLRFADLSSAQGLTAEQLEKAKKLYGATISKSIAEVLRKNPKNAQLLAPD